MLIRNHDISEIILAVPEGHKHLRATIKLKDGSEIVLQEAAVANLARAWVTVKSHPVKTAVRLTGRQVQEAKEGYAEWQLLEDD